MLINDPNQEPCRLAPLEAFSNELYHQGKARTELLVTAGALLHPHAEDHETPLGQREPGPAGLGVRIGLDTPAQKQAVDAGYKPPTSPAPGDEPGTNRHG